MISAWLIIPAILLGILIGIFAVRICETSKTDDNPDDQEEDFK